MRMIKGKYEFENGTQAKVYRDEDEEVMVKLIIPSYTSMVLPLEELDEFVDNVYNSFDEV